MSKTNAEHVEATSRPLCDLPGYVHGIVSLDPPTVQCDGCQATYSHRRLALAVLLCGMWFSPTEAIHGDGRRLCRECARKAGWDE